MGGLSALDLGFMGLDRRDGDLPATVWGALLESRLCLCREAVVDQRNHDRHSDVPDKG
jgi:hypothetical protein